MIEQVDRELEEKLGNALERRDKLWEQFDSTDSKVAVAGRIQEVEAEIRGLFQQCLSWRAIFPDKALPARFSVLLAVAFNEVALGRKHHWLFEPERSSGDRSYSPQETTGIAAAVAYRLAAEKGAVQDRSPIKTLSQLYGRKPRTVRKWMEDARYLYVAEILIDGLDDSDQREHLSAQIVEAATRSGSVHKNFMKNKNYFRNIKRR